MSVSKTRCLGIDLTQQKPMMALAEGTKIVECKTLEDTPPAALLPIVQDDICNYLNNYPNLFPFHPWPQ